MAKTAFVDLKPAIIVWNDAYQDAGFDGPLEDVPLEDHLQQTTVGFLIKNDKKVVKFCNELCEQTKHVRNIVCIPRRYVVSVTPLHAILTPAAETPTKE